MGLKLGLRNLPRPSIADLLALEPATHFIENDLAFSKAGRFLFCRWQIAAGFQAVSKLVNNFLIRQNTSGILSRNASLTGG
jgi:hypothetical protein